MNGTTPRQEQILRFIRRFIGDRKRPPSIRDIQIGCAISSTSVVDYNLRALERRGFLKREREYSRAIELVLEEGDSCPYCGRLVVERAQ